MPVIKTGIIKIADLPKFPAVLCVSVNEEVVHGIPSEDRFLAEGDIVGLDFGALHKGFYSDAAVTLAVGKVDEETQRLLDVTSEALKRGIAEARIGNRIGDISNAVQNYVEESGFSVVKVLYCSDCAVMDLPSSMQVEQSSRRARPLARRSISCSSLPAHLSLPPVLNLQAMLVR